MKKKREERGDYERIYRLSRDRGGYERCPVSDRNGAVVSENQESLKCLSVASEWASDPWKFEDYGELYQFELGLGVEGRTYLLSVIPTTIPDRLTEEVWLFASFTEMLPDEPPRTLAKCLFDPMVKDSHTIASEALRIAKSEGNALPAGWQIWVNGVNND